MPKAQLAFSLGQSVYIWKMGNSTVTELQIRDFGLLFNHFVLYSYDLIQFEYFYKVQRYPCHHLKHKICQSSLLFRDQRYICESVTELPENWAKF